ncbi:MAG: twin-arginine translocase subunit TatC [Cyclobacteriaceae bacterium]|nr:twin-arginine translocase subunit TatC [Cyclobacteriaceae bacterium]UYN86958.1 MAG: twin-arginine translocase subunit TatC [Cyclobacteriaceae bacterium]
MAEEKEMTFLDHLEELRWHIIRSLLVVVVCTIVAFIYGKWIFDHVVFAVAQPDFIFFDWMCSLGKLVGYTETLCVDEIPFKIQSRQMTGQFTMHIASSLFIGVTTSFPYIVWELWRFIKPGLVTKERKFSRGAVLSISFLFFTGVSFGYFIMSPLAVYFLSTYSLSDVIVNEFDITSYVSTIITLVFGSGLLFQLPVVVYFLTKIGMLTPAFMRQYRRHAIVIILIVAAIITPPDPFSQTLIGIPLYLLYEFSILISAIVVKRQAKRDREEEQSYKAP